MTLLTAHVESLTSSMDEWASFHPAHFAALALNQDRVPLAVNYDGYREMDAKGRILFVALRDEGRMVGYFVGMVMPCLHYGILTCTTDIFWVSPSVRGRFGGVRLFRAVKAECARLGVKRLFVGEKLHAPAGRLFAYLGFKPIEQYHSIMIG